MLQHQEPLIASAAPAIWMLTFTSPKVRTIKGWMVVEEERENDGVRSILEILPWVF